MGEESSDSASDKPLEALVARAVEGDREAQGELLRAFWPVIRAAVRARLSEVLRNVGAEDISQEVAMRMLQRLPTFRGDGSTSLGAWVRAITDNVMVDLVRRERAKKRGRADTGPLDREVAAPQSCSCESQVHLMNQAEQVSEQLKLLEDAERVPLLLHHAGYTYAELGDVLAISAEAARKRVERITEKLRGQLT